MDIIIQYNCIEWIGPTNTIVPLTLTQIGLSVFGTMQMAKRKWRNGDNNRTLTLDWSHKYNRPANSNPDRAFCIRHNANGKT